jgi:phosphoenolpyruvate carboxylase
MTENYSGVTEDPHKPLRDDVRMLGGLLGETLRLQEGPALFERVERVRALAKRSRREGPAGDQVFETLASELRSMPTEAAIPIARSFAHFLNLANIAEQHHRMRRRRAYQRNPQGRPQQGSIEETLPRLVAGGLPPDTLYEVVRGLRIELVITAHPTEIMRRTLQHKYWQIAGALADLDRPDLTPFEREALLETIRREITAAWETEEVRHERPSPLDEVRSAMAVFEETLWDALPQFCRSLDRTLRSVTGQGLPLDAAPIRFGSWIGGDRDGNPSVTPDVTRRACLMSRWTALTLYAKEIEALRFELSMGDATAELRARAGAAYEPYRSVLRQLQQRLERTLRAIEERLAADTPTAIVAPQAGSTVEDAEDFVEPLHLCYRSLCETGNQLIADGRLADTLRRVSAFGLTLVRLDVRQEADRHTEAMDAITRHLGFGSYEAWTEERRIDFLLNVLTHDHGLSLGTMTPPAGGPAAGRVAEVIDTFRMIAAIPRDSWAPTSSPRPGAPPTSSRSSCCSAKPASRLPSASSRSSRRRATSAPARTS